MQPRASESLSTRQGRRAEVMNIAHFQQGFHKSSILNYARSERIFVRLVCGLTTTST